MTKKKIFIAILNQGTTASGFETQMWQWMMEYGDKYAYDYFPSKYSYRPISNNRNHIVKDFLQGDCEYLLMIDDDNPPLKNPLDFVKFDKDVIGAIVPGRDLNGIHFHVYRFGKDPNKITFEQYENKEIKDLTKIDAIGTGCIMVKRKVLEKIKRPFEDWFDDDGIMITNDDMYFSIKCHKEGFEVWTHGEYMCSHYKTFDLLQMAHLVIKAHDRRKKTKKGN